MMNPENINNSNDRKKIIHDFISLVPNDNWKLCSWFWTSLPMYAVGGTHTLRNSLIIFIKYSVDIMVSWIT